MLQYAAHSFPLRDNGDQRMNFNPEINKNLDKLCHIIKWMEDILGIITT